MGELRDNTVGRLYRINFSILTAAPMTASNLKPDTPDEIRQARNSRLGDDFVDGVRCRKPSVVIAWRGQDPEHAEQSCISLEDALEVGDDYTSTRNSVTTHELTETYDFVPGTEPDAKLFDISSYTAYRPAPR